MSHLSKIGATFLVALFLFSPPSFGLELSELYPGLENEIAAGNYTGAVKLLKDAKESFSSHDRVLYHLEMGMLLHISGEYKESNEFLQRAEEDIDEYFTTSVSNEVGAFLTSDKNLDFQGEDFEKVVLNLIRAMNYAMLGDYEGALVEARKVDHKLNLLSERLKEKKNAYRQDAFARYLSGVLYESMNETNDAYIAYKKSYEAYKIYQRQYGTKIPNSLKSDLRRLSAELGIPEDSRKYKKLFGNIAYKKVKSGEGEVVFLSYNGLSPTKHAQVREIFIDIIGAPYLMKIAFPRFRLRDSPIAWAEISLAPTKGKDYKAKSFEVENLSAIGVQDLSDRISRIETKAIARATTKYIAVKTAEYQAREQFGELGGFLAGIAGNVMAFQTEEVDERSWRLLPGQIHMARLSVPVGTYQAKVTFYSIIGAKLSQENLGEVLIQEGRKTFLKTRQSPSSGFTTGGNFDSVRGKTQSEKVAQNRVVTPKHTKRVRREKNNLFEIGFPFGTAPLDGDGQDMTTEGLGGFSAGVFSWEKDQNHHLGLGILLFSHMLPATVDDPSDTPSLSHFYFTGGYRYEANNGAYAGFDLGVGSTNYYCNNCQHESQSSFIPLAVLGFTTPRLGINYKFGPYSGGATGNKTYGESDLTWSGTINSLSFTFRY